MTWHKFLSELPDRYRSQVAAYIDFGHTPGSNMVRHIICGDTDSAVLNTPPETPEDLYLVCRWFRMRPPHECYGSRDAYDRWQHMKFFERGEATEESAY